MKRLPLIQSSVSTINMVQNRWKSILDVLLGNPSLDCSILSDISLVPGANVINHKLGRKLQGWRIVRVNGSVSIYDIQDSNTIPELTLILHSSTNVVISLEVF